MPLAVKGEIHLISRLDRLFVDEGKETGVFAGCGEGGRAGAARTRGSVARATPQPPAARYGRPHEGPRAAHRDRRAEQRVAPAPVPGRPAPRRRRGLPPSVRRQRPPHPAGARAGLLRDAYTLAAAAPYKYSLGQIRIPCRRHVHGYPAAAVLCFSIPGTLQ